MSTLLPYTTLFRSLRMEHRASLSSAEREIERIEARRKKLVESIMEGVPASEVKDELNANAARREQLKTQLAAAASASQPGCSLPREGHDVGSRPPGCRQPFRGR